jgi:hypothetical protein
MHSSPRAGPLGRGSSRCGIGAGAHPHRCSAGAEPVGVRAAQHAVVNERRGRLTESDTAAFLRSLARLGVTVDRSPVEADVLTLARRHRLIVYDAAIWSWHGATACRWRRSTPLSRLRRVPNGTHARRAAAVTLPAGLMANLWRGCASGCSAQSFGVIPGRRAAANPESRRPISGA